MIAFEAAQVFANHLSTLLSRKANTRLSDDEHQSTASLIRLLLEAEQSGETSYPVGDAELTAPMRQVLLTPPLRLHRSAAGEELLFTERTLAAVRGVEEWFSNQSKNDSLSVASTAAKEKMLFVPPVHPAGGLKLGESDQVPAILTAALNNFSVITGGPGTGKTTIIAACLAELLLRDPQLQPEEIVLCAPTGKAAQRLSQGINDFRSLYLGGVDDSLRSRMARIPEAKTLHKLLGASPTRSLPLEGTIAKIAERVVVVDECSMVGAELMCTLLKSLNADARLILVGDSDQLPAVECGAVFRDLVERMEKERSPQLQRLIHTRRSVPEIVREAKKALERGLEAEFPWRPFGRDEALCAEPVRFINGLEGMKADAKYSDWLDVLIDRIFELYASTAHWAAGEKGSTVFKIIVPNRSGVAGVADINRRMHELARVRWKMRRSGEFPGEPLIVTENIHHLGLNNGDVGIVEAATSPLPFSSADSGEVQVRFTRGSQQAVFPIDLLTGRIEHAWASTCHKAQGSEYENVFIILPESDGKIVTTHWLYTAMTRAKSRVTLIKTHKK